MSCHEQYLIDSISDTVYQIDRKHLSLADSPENAQKNIIFYGLIRKKGLKFLICVQDESKAAAVNIE